MNDNLIEIMFDFVEVIEKLKVVELMLEFFYCVDLLVIELLVRIELC